METTIVLIRHGESQGNLNCRFIGHGDVPLTPLGEKQAEMTAEYVKDKYKFDVIIASDLQRAYNTAKKIATLQNKEIIKDSRFREVNAGLWEGVPFEELPKKFSKQHYLWTHDIGNAHIEGGESAKDLYDRVNTALFDVINKYKGKTVLIVCHATPIRMMECKIMDKDVFYAKDVEFVPNASVTAVKYDGEKFTILERGTCDYMGDLETKLPKNS